jgi:hypothetical protein
VRLLPERREARYVLAAVAVVVALNVIAIGVDALLPSPEGPPSSSFATSRQGMAAWAELLRRNGREVRRLRERPSDATLPTEGTVVMLDPESFTRGQARALRRFAERGGHVVAGGADPGDWLGALAGGAPLRWDEDGDSEARVLVPAPETAGAASLRTAEVGHWERAGDALPLVAGDDGPVVLAEAVGDGRIAYVADASPLQNRLLGEADNAALALALAGQGPVVFVESVHGYTTATGLAALPARFQWALVLLGLSGLVLIAARWPRMGPPEPPEEPLFPPRRAYVDALAATLAKTHDRRAAIESVRSAARERLARRAALTRDAQDEAWFDAARAAGLDDQEARALVEGDDNGIGAGRALAKMSGGGARPTGHSVSSDVPLGTHGSGRGGARA